MKRAEFEHAIRAAGSVIGANEVARRGSGANPAVSATTERLTTALADRYRIERGLGAGGMGHRVPRPRVRHDRPVIIKVLRTEIAHPAN